MGESFRLGIAGLGTVGAGVIKILQAHGDMIASRAGRPIEVVCVSARSKDKDRGVDLSAVEWVDNPVDMAARDDIDAVVEMIGGSEGAALDLTRKALENGKHVITANKAMLAHHGLDLAALAEKKGVSLAYEAAVAGGIPIIKALREGFASNEISGVYGILNGTCNYILTQMRETGRDFEDVLKEAQDKGYAEADPGFDVDGIDAGHKLALLTSLAYGVKPDFENLPMTGIRQITSADIEVAAELGYKIKLLGVSKKLGSEISQFVEPCLVRTGSPIAAIEGVYNAVYVDGDFMDTPMLSGRGAGEGPTATAVLADVIDLVRGHTIPTFGMPAKELQTPDPFHPGQVRGRYYLRLNVLDKVGVTADVAAILRDNNISLETIIQHGRDPGQPVSMVILTYEVSHKEVSDAMALINKLDVSCDQPVAMRIIEEL